jgi:hypothetical protein
MRVIWKSHAAELAECQFLQSMDYTKYAAVQHAAVPLAQVTRLSAQLAFAAARKRV